MTNSATFSEDERQSPIDMMTHLSAYGFYYKCPKRPDGRWLGPLVACSDNKEYVSDTYVSFRGVPHDFLVNWAEELTCLSSWTDIQPDCCHPLSPECRLSSALTSLSRHSRKRCQPRGILTNITRIVSRLFSRSPESVVLVDDVLGENDIKPVIDHISKTGRVVKLIACFINTLPECAYFYNPGQRREPIPVISLASIMVWRFLSNDPFVAHYIKESPTHIIEDPHTQLSRDRMMVIMRKRFHEYRPST